MGTSVRVPVEAATFANGCAVRYLDFNDTYLSKEAIHPSDNIPGIMAVGEAEGATGKDVILGIVSAYDVACKLADAFSIRNLGWDHVTYISISSALGAAKVMSLGVEQVEQAVNLAVVPNVALRQTRAGELSMWKGCAAANAARNGVFAAVLAKHGMTGPSPAFEGEMGFFKQLAESFDLDMLEGPHKVLHTLIKNHPAEYHAMSAVDAVLEARQRMNDVQLDGLDVDTFMVAWQIIAKDPEKWNPQTRETADHSLPFIVDRAFLDGGIWLDSYDPQKLTDANVKRLLKLTKVRVDPEMNAMYPQAVPNRVTLRSGSKSETVEVDYPKGHFKNPMTDAEIERKYLRLGAPGEALPALWRFDQCSLDDVVQALEVEA